MPTQLVEARRKVAQELGGFGTFFATGGSTSTAICTSAFRSTELPASHLAYVWLYSPTSATPKQRRIKAGGLAAGSGTITLDDVLGTAIGSGTIFELHTRLPAARELSASDGQTLVMGIHECINAALRHLLTEVTRPLSLVSGQQEYPLTDSYLKRRERLIDIREPNVTGGAKRSTPRIYELRPGAASHVLHFDQPYRFNSGAYSVDLVVKRPADGYVKVGSADFADSTVGLVGETDQAAVELNDLVTVALVYAYQALRMSRTGAERSRYADLYVKQLQAARNLADYDHTADIDPSVPGAAAPVAAEAA